MSNKFFSNPLNVVMIVVLVVLIVGLVLELTWKHHTTVPTNNARNCQLIAQSCLLQYPNDEVALNKCVIDFGCPVI
jgi:hypothetical protein